LRLTKLAKIKLDIFFTLQSEFPKTLILPFTE